MSTVQLRGFFDEYCNELKKIEAKVILFNNALSTAFKEVTLLLPEAQTSLLSLTDGLRKINHKIRNLNIHTFESRKILTIQNEFQAITFAFSDISNYLTIYNDISGLTRNIIRIFKIAYDIVADINDDFTEKDLFKTINCLKIAQERIVMGFKNIAREIDCFVHELPKIFNSMSKMLIPPLTMEAMLAGKSERSKISIIKDNINNMISDEALDKSVRNALSPLPDSLEPLEELSRKTTELLSLSKVSVRKMDQPYTDILFINNTLLQLAFSLETLMNDLYDGDAAEINCDDFLQILEKLIPHDVF